MYLLFLLDMSKLPRIKVSANIVHEDVLKVSKVVLSFSVIGISLLVMMTTMLVMSEDHEILCIRAQIIRNHVTLEKESSTLFASAPL